MLREAIALGGRDYVDIEVDVASKIRRYGKTKRVVSYHSYKGLPEDLQEIAHQCDESDADVVKLAVNVESVAEASQVLKMSANSPAPDDRGRDGRNGRVHPHPGSRKSQAHPGPTPGFNPNASFSARDARAIATYAPRLRLFEQIDSRNRGLRRRRRPDRAQPEPGHPQRVVPPSRPEQGHGADSDPGRNPGGLHSGPRLAQHQGGQRHHPAQVAT